MSANDVGFSVCTTSKQWDCLNAQMRMNHCQGKYKNQVKACQGTVSIVTYITIFLNAFSWFCCHGLSEMTMKNGIVSFCCINIYYTISLYRSEFFHSMYPYLGSSIYLQTSFFLFYSWIVFRHICVPNFHYSLITLKTFRLLLFPTNFQNDYNNVFPPTGFFFLHNLVSNFFSWFVDFSHLTGIRRNLKVALICISLVVKNVVVILSLL